MTKWIIDGLAVLSAQDKHFNVAFQKVGVPKFQTRTAEFATLLNLILGQQVSVASARALYRKLEVALGQVTPDNFLRLSDDDLRAIGFSRQKAVYGRDLAEHVAEGRLDIDHLQHMDDFEVEATLTKVKGIGRWTAENYLIFALERPNVWPAFDLAVQEGLKRVKNMRERPNAKKVDLIGKKFAPHRSAAALFCWHYLEDN